MPNLDFRIAKYVLKDKGLPAPGYTSNFYIIIPKTIPTVEAEIALSSKLQSLVNFGLIKTEDYSLKIPLESRLTGEHRGFSYLAFSSEVEIITTANIKALLHDSFVYFPSLDKLYHLPVFWAKENKPVQVPIIKILKRE